ncbi:MAG: hypothetical protein H6Q49_1632 [Deltaproteobacteria bacterium]|nr:hypothetical protein [Deltaproteobacteria bacterium]
MTISLLDPGEKHQIIYLPQPAVNHFPKFDL